ncbi:MAG TPA: tannase/feruloyl esterase family alpha/beta hydrolase [Burkholderiales bacterium]|jgi:feruloyl esterase|nr:tannase/feruloyl esterase family alpha/beta hydrolase [Burkholderiales bacterium]
MARPVHRVPAALVVFAAGISAASVVLADAAHRPVPSAERCAAFLSAHLSLRDDAAYGHGGQAEALARNIQPAITAATWKTASGAVPEYCRVEGTITTGDAKAGFGQVRFAVNLPSGWNGRFVMIGDGGFDGAVSSSTSRVDQGYATANSDMGNNSSIYPGASFGFNNRPREIDYGWRATHVTTVVAKGVIDAYYGNSPKYSYWEGCSTGGRQAAVEVQRFPDDFHGVVAGDLFMNAIEIAMEQIWSSAVFFRDVDGNGVGFDNNITQADIDALRDAVLAKCDVLGNDKIKDNVVGNPLACQRVFADSDVDAFGAARGLRPGQIQAIKDVYRGPHNSHGHRWYKGKPLGSEFSWGSFVVPTPANKNFPAQGGFSFQLANFLWFEHDPGVPTARPNDPSLLPGPGEYRWLDFDFDRNRPNGRTIHPGDSGMWDPRDGGAFMREILNGSQTDLSPFLVQNKGKYLLYHGFADGLIGPEPTIDYYDGIVRDTFHGKEKRADDRVRLFLVPGMSHCAGGVRGAAVGWDKLAPLVAWVEQNQAPDSIVVTQDSGTVTPQGNQRILCPWPQQPTYVGPSGSGAENNPANWVASNFECQAPR